MMDKMDNAVAAGYLASMRQATRKSCHNDPNGFIPVQLAIP
jgi:hypothetical protein